MLRCMQTMQLSCIKIGTISEQTKSSLHLSLFNYEYHRVRLKWFLSLWCIRCKPCTYLLPKLTLSLNEVANLDRLPDTPECQGVRTSIRAHLIAAMGQTATLLKRVQDVSHTEAASDQTRRSRASPSRRRRSRSPDNRRGDSRRDDGGRDANGLASRTAYAARKKKINTGISVTTSLPKMTGTASTGAPQREQSTKTCAASSTMRPMVLRA